MTEDEMVGWHHRLDGHECEQAPGVAVLGFSLRWFLLLQSMSSRARGLQELWLEGSRASDQ